MNRDDFNMYLSGSFLTTLDGKLTQIEECDGNDTVYYVVYDSPSDYESFTTPLDCIDEVFDFEGFDLKPFEVDGKAYSPSYSSMRGVKDGVNHRRINLSPMGHTHRKECTSGDIITMFFDPIGSVEDAMSNLIDGHKKFSALKDGFYLVREVLDEDEDKEPFCELRVTLTEEGNLRVATGSFSKVITNSTRFSKIPEDFPLEGSIGFTNLARLSKFLADRGVTILGKVPTSVLNHYMSWADNNKNYIPKLELFRHGMSLCTLGEEIPSFFSGLPTLTEYIQELTNEYKSIAMRNRA